jgi:hypothetical protein
MRPVRLASTVLLFALAISPALAQQPRGGGGAPPPPAPPGPYKSVPVTLPKPFGDATFDAFRAKLADVAKRKDRAGLAALIVAKGFFWQRGEGKPVVDPKKAGIDVLATAIGLDAKDGSGWETVAGYAAEPTAEPVPQMKGVMCAPATAGFNEKDFDGLLSATKTDPSEWVYPTAAGVEMRAKGDAAAPVVEKLGLNLLRALPESGDAGGEWVRVVAPSGKVGFVQTNSLSPLGSEQLCYLKDAAGWHIAGYSGGGEQ